MTAPLLNARQLVWVSRVLRDDHYKCMPGVTVSLFVCLLVLGFSCHSRIFNSYGNVTIAQWRIANFDRCSALKAIKQWGFFSVQHLQWHIYCDTQKTCDTYTYCRAFGAVTTCFYDVGLSLLGFEHPTFRLRGHRCVRHSRRGTLKNPQCSMPISAMYRLKFEALHRWWWRIYLSEKFSSGT